MGQVFKVKRNGDLFEAPTEIPGPDRRVLVDEVGEFISEAEEIDTSLLGNIPPIQRGQTAPLVTPPQPGVAVPSSEDAFAGFESSVPGPDQAGPSGELNGGPTIPAIAAVQSSGQQPGQQPEAPGGSSGFKKFLEILAAVGPTAGAVGSGLARGRGIGRGLGLAAAGVESTRRFEAGRDIAQQKIDATATAEKQRKLEAGTAAAIAAEKERFRRGRLGDQDLLEAAEVKRETAQTKLTNTLARDKHLLAVDREQREAGAPLTARGKLNAGVEAGRISLEEAEIEHRNLDRAGESANETDFRLVDSMLARKALTPERANQMKQNILDRPPRGPLIGSLGPNAKDVATAKREVARNAAFEDKITAGAAGAEEQLSRIKILEGLYAGIEKGGGKLGVGRELILDAASAARTFGFEGLAKAFVSDEQMTSFEAIRSLTNKMALAQHIKGTGPMSDRDFEVYKGIVGGLGNTIEGNRQILRLMRALTQRRDDMKVFMLEWEKANGKLPGGADFQLDLREWRDQNPMFYEFTTKESMKKALKGGLLKPDTLVLKDGILKPLGD